MDWIRGGCVMVAVAATCLFQQPAAHARTSTSTFVGKWHLNAMMSKAPPGETPPADLMTDISRADALHVRWAVTSVDAKGQKDTESFDAPANGEFYPVSGDTTAAFTLTSTSLQGTFKDSTGQTDSLTCTLSGDTRRMTCNGKMSQPNGSMVPYVDVFDRT